MDIVPEDIIEFLEDCGLKHKVVSVRRSVKDAIASGLLIAEIIHSKFPRLVQV